MSERQADYITDATEMLGSGYEHPALEIEQERTVITRRNGKLTEETRPAFVKISTAFKAEMKDIDPIALKVWLYIALSVNRATGKAYPGLRTISKDCDLAVNTIQAALVRLENLQLLTIDRDSKRFNLYEPADYVSANRLEPSVSADDTHAQTVSVDAQTVSSWVIHNQRNQSKPDIAGFQKIEQSANKTVDAILEQARQSNSKSWTKLPAPYDQYARAFCEATGLSYQKKYFSDWCSTFDEWMVDGIQPSVITKAVRAIQGMDSPTSISRPGSLTWKLKALKAAAPVSQPAVNFPPVSLPTGAIPNPYKKPAFLTKHTGE